MTRTLQLALATYRPRKPVPDRTLFDPSVTQLRVRLTDLDFYRHMNNGVYLQCMDVGRSNYLADLGAFEALNAKRWYPVVAAQTIKYRRSLTLGQRFDVTTTLVGWDDRVAYLEQVFSRAGQHVARGIVAGRFLGRGGERVPAPDVVALLPQAPPHSPALPDEVLTWARAIDVAQRASEA